MDKNYKIKILSKIEKIPDNKKAYILTFVSTLFIFFIICLVHGIVPFGNNSLCINDGMAQYIPFISDLYDKLKNGENLFYSYNGGLGYNLFGTMAYYLMSPFTFLILLFKKENIKIAVQLIIILKMCCVSTGMNYYLLNRFKLKNRILSICFSLAYAFSYFFLGYMYNFMWLDCIILLPFILRGLETINTKKGKIQYSFCLAFAMISNFYLAVILCIFLFLYYIFIIDYKDLKDFIKKTFTFGSFSILAALMACIVLIPIGLNIISMGSSRTSFPDFSFFNEFVYVFKNHLPFTELTTLSRNEGNVNIFCSVCAFLFASLFLFNKTIPLKRRIGTTILTSFILFSFTNSWTNFIMHGFYSQRQIPNRFAFLYVFLIIVMAYETLTTLKGVSKKAIMIGCVGIIVSLTAIATQLDLSLTNDSSILNLGGFVYCLAFIVIYLILISKSNNSLNKIALFLILETLLNIIKAPSTGLSDSYYMQTNYQNAMVQNNDNSFYREELLSSTTTNAPTLYGMNGLTTFNSIINSKTASFLGKIGFAAGENYYRYLGHTPLTDALFNIKYIYSKYGENLPFNFEHIGTVENINVYQNKYILPIGFSADFSSLETNYGNKFDNLNGLTREYGTLFRGIPINTIFESEKAQITKKDNSNFVVNCNKGDVFTFTLTSIEDKNLYIYTKASATTNLTIKVNDKVITSSSYSGYISYLGDIKKEDIITLKYTPKTDFNNTPVTIFISSLNEDIFKAYYYDTLDHALTNVIYNGNIINAKYTALEDNTQIIFTLPYNKGWSIFVDGKEQEVENIQDAFIAVTVNEGEHDIELKYIPEGFEIGAIVSFITTLGMLGFALIPSKSSLNFHKYN